MNADRKIRITEGVYYDKAKKIRQTIIIVDSVLYRSVQELDFLLVKLGDNSPRQKIILYIKKRFTLYD
jgi:hypothetical protein